MNGKINVRDRLKKIQEKYNELLNYQSHNTIRKALDYLNKKKKAVAENKDLSQITLDDNEVQKVFDLMQAYQQEIKQLFLEAGETITHITNVSPENMRDGKIKRSMNRANNYETDIGNWVFASSNPMDGKNPYIARNPRDGMILIAPNTYIYGGNNIQVQSDKHGQRHVVLEKPNYIYHIKPDNFSPVVTLVSNKNGDATFAFSEEWISDYDIDINDSNQVSYIEEISDITEVVSNYQILCDVNKTGEAIRIRNCKSRNDALNQLLQSIRNGKLRYINGEANINISAWVQNQGLIKSIAKSTISSPLKDTAKRRVAKDSQTYEQSINIE